jgi:hypothetical protein
MAEDHDWHLFDALRDLEVRHINGVYEVRERDTEKLVGTFTPEQFDKYRGGSDNVDSN